MEFTNEQKYSLLSKMGYTGPAEGPMMEAYLSSNPGAAAKMGKFTRALQKRQGMATGGTVTPGTQLTESLIQDPSKLADQAPVAQLSVTPGTDIAAGTGTAEATTTAPAAQAAASDTATAGTKPETVMATTSTATPAVTKAVNETQAAQGTVSKNSLVADVQGKLSPEALAQAPTFDNNFAQQVTAGQVTVAPNQLVTAAGQDEKAVTAQVATAAPVKEAVAQQGTVSANELPEAAQIKEADMAQAQVIQDQGLNKDAVAVAAQLDKFSVSSETLAQAVQGNVTAQDTVQGQLTQLMKSFDNGTPAWAAGALRAANAAMAARGLGGSTMAGAAILQAAMESAIPIAAQDAQTFAQMNLTNLNNKQQVALANAAAQQGLALQNLDNRQKAALQNSANAFALQSQNLSNAQSVVIANAQIKASLQGQNLSNQQQANLAVAARYAEVANQNLNNRQQTALQNNMNSVNVSLANLSAAQEAYITNANLAAALQGQQISNKQQAAIANAARYAEAANINFTAEQQAKIHNSTMMQTIGLANLDAKQATTLQNAAALAAMDMANLDNRQKAAVQNAQAFLAMDMANLSNEQQVEMFRAQSIVQGIFSDQAAENATRQLNATSANQTNQFFADLSSRVSMFNTEQKNAINQFNAGEKNTTERFNAQMEAARKQFNANNSLVIAQANAQWRQNIATINTAAQNESNMEMARTSNALTAKALDEIWQKERDGLAYAFTANESEKDRVADLLLSDKRDALAKWTANDANETAKTAAIIKLIASDWP